MTNPNPQLVDERHHELAMYAARAACDESSPSCMAEAAATAYSGTLAALAKSKEAARTLVDLPVIEPGDVIPQTAAQAEPASDKPPLGLRPEAIADEEFNSQRVEEIRQAMGRYIAAGMEFPSEWVDELHRRSAGERAFKLTSDGLYLNGKLLDPVNGAFQIRKAAP